MSSPLYLGESCVFDTWLYSGRLKNMTACCFSIRFLHTINFYEVETQKVKHETKKTEQMRFKKKKKKKKRWQVRLKPKGRRLVKASECCCERLLLLWAAGRALVDLRSVRFPWSLNKAIWSEECGLGTLPATHWKTNSERVRLELCVCVCASFEHLFPGTDGWGKILQVGTWSPHFTSTKG